MTIAVSPGRRHHEEEESMRPPKRLFKKRRPQGRPMDLRAVLRGNKVWEEFQAQQDRDPQRINLTALWMAAGRPPLSPRRWRQHYYRAREVTPEGASDDDPVWGDAAVAIRYAMQIDPAIKQVIDAELAGLDSGAWGRGKTGHVSPEPTAPEPRDFMLTPKGLAVEFWLDRLEEEGHIEEAYQIACKMFPIRPDDEGGRVSPAPAATSATAIELLRQKYAQAAQENEAERQKIEATRQRIEALRQEAEALRQENEAKCQENAQLGQKIAAWGQEIEATAARGEELDWSAEPLTLTEDGRTVVESVIEALRQRAAQLGERFEAPTEINRESVLRLIRQMNAQNARMNAELARNNVQLGQELEVRAEPILGRLRELDDLLAQLAQCTQVNARRGREIEAMAAALA
jgi:hypothetical protein